LERREGSQLELDWRSKKAAVARMMRVMVEATIFQRRATSR
jgi:hypothetical protein